MSVTKLNVVMSVASDFEIYMFYEKNNYGILNLTVKQQRTCNTRILVLRIHKQYKQFDQNGNWHDTNRNHLQHLL